MQHFQKFESNASEVLPSKNNDSAGSHVINHVPGILRKNLKDIDNLTLNKRFTPFPTRPKTLQLNPNGPFPVGSVPLSTDSRVYHPGVLREGSFFKIMNQRRFKRQFNARINNKETLNQIINLPPQNASDPLVYEFFNGTFM